MKVAMSQKSNGKYPLAIRILHWAMAIVIIGLIALGWFMTPYSEDNPHLSEQLYFWHKSFGMLMFFLILVRISVRRKANIEALPSSLAAWEVRAASVSHFLLYVLMILVPFSGYSDSSSYEYSSGVHFFLFDLPQVIPDNEFIQKISNASHKIFAYGLLAIISAHAAGAIKHRFFDNDKTSDVFPRILISGGDMRALFKKKS